MPVGTSSSRRRTPSNSTATSFTGGRLALSPEVSAAPSYKKAASVTIDNIDRVAGRVAMVWALANNQRGHFGFRDEANDVVPEPE